MKGHGHPNICDSVLTSGMLLLDALVLALCLVYGFLRSGVRCILRIGDRWVGECLRA